VYEETAALLITRDEVKAEEDLAVMLWDSDKRSAEYVAHIFTYFILQTDCYSHLVTLSVVSKFLSRSS
jgi:hypothetical protein